MVESLEDKLRRACETLGLSIPQACDLAGINYKTLSTQLRRGSRIPFESIDALSHALDLPMSYFSRRTPLVSINGDENSRLADAAARFMNAAVDQAHIEMLRSQDQIGTMDVLNWLRRTNYRLEDFDALRESADLFHKVSSDDQVPRPYRIGKQSLATVAFGIENEDHYMRTLSDFNPKVLNNIMSARAEATYHPYTISDVNLSVTIGGEVVRESYCRLIAKVYLPDNSELTLVHSQMVPSIRQSDRGAVVHDLTEPQANHASDHPEA